MKFKGFIDQYPIERKDVKMVIREQWMLRSATKRLNHKVPHCRCKKTNPSDVSLQESVRRVPGIAKSRGQAQINP